MKTFVVPFTHYITVDVIVEADNEQDAKDKAKILIQNNYISSKGDGSLINNHPNITLEPGQDYDILEDEIFEL
jgi:hypothetical protein